MSSAFICWNNMLYYLTFTCELKVLVLFTIQATILVMYKLLYQIERLLNYITVIIHFVK